MKAKRSNSRGIEDQPSTRARLGWFAVPVQAAVRKWAASGIPEWQLERYYVDVAKPVVLRGCEAAISVAAPEHWPAVWELAAAIQAVCDDEKKIEAHLLRNWNAWASTNGELTPWKSFPGEFKADAIRKAAQRLRLNGPE